MIRADEHTRHPSLDGLIPLTCNEIQRLFTMLVVQPVHDVAHWLAWSAWHVATRPEPRTAITGGRRRRRHRVRLLQAPQARRLRRRPHLFDWAVLCFFDLR